MAAIIPQPVGKSKTPLHTVRIDMTPMVDLGFLLITFFIFTTSLMESTKIKLTMPKETGDAVPVFEKTLLTILVDKDKAYVYEGAWAKAMAESKILRTNYNVQTGVGYFIRQKQKSLGDKRDELMVAIKPLSSANYQDVMNALDEMLVNNVKRYAIIDASKDEKTFIATKN